MKMIDSGFGASANPLRAADGKRQPGGKRPGVFQRKIYSLFLCIVALWSVAIGAGFAYLVQYAATAGEGSATAARWPTGSVLIPGPGRANLVLLVHPHCPCSEATMGELEKLLARCHGQVSTHVLFYRPGASPDNWEKTHLWYRAAALPDTRLHADVDGAQARLFGATTSGHVSLYHADGHLLFSGGITNTRGHAGSSAGTEAILSLLTSGTAARTETPVYGCPLNDPCACECKGANSCRD
jgi:hypothetical protein